MVNIGSLSGSYQETIVKFGVFHVLVQNDYTSLVESAKQTISQLISTLTSNISLPAVPYVQFLLTL